MSDATVLETPAPADGQTAPGERWWPSPGGMLARAAVLAALLGFLVLLPHLIPGVFLRVIARAVVYAIIAFSMNILVGYTGQVSLGHGAFVGIGAFSAGIITANAGLPYVVALAVAAATGAIAAIVLGGVALRVKGLYLAIVTIAYVLFTQNTLFNIRSITGGGAGQPVPRPGFATGDIAFIYFCMGILALVWIFDWRLTSSKAGRAIQALRDDERVAATWGINVTGYKLLAFVLSGAIAGIAGALHGAIEEIATPTSYGFIPSITFLLMTVVGGLGSRPGIVQGGFVFATLGTLLEQAHSTWIDCTTAWLGGFVQMWGYMPLLGPRLIQFLLGAGMLAGGFALGAALVRRKWDGLGGAVAMGVGALVMLGFGAVLFYGSLVGTACMWRPLTALYEPLIGALLLLLTLIFFPGGIAEQQEDLIRWLSFRRFHEPETGVAVADDPSGGDTGAHA